jgi:hypothetical protein
MNVRRMLSIIFFFLTVVVVLALAPTINTANTTAYAAWGAATQNASMIGLGAVMPFGAPLMILSIMVAFGLLAFGMKEGASVKDILGSIGVTIAQVIAVTLFTNVITYTNTLLTGSTGIATVIYGIIPLAIYMAIIAAAGAVGIVKYARSRRGRKSSSSSMANY